ncbi:hypothetical protein ON010_g2638 [Phytophthora cinnamomi]|nr:hypothetical protein ON010_g2638 [Phytophthora cinnamomi]
MSRLRGIEARFPNVTVGLTFLVSQEDQQVSLGGLSSTGFRRSDASTIIRARRYINVETPSSCETMFVENYRYETGLLSTDISGYWRRSELLVKVTSLLLRSQYPDISEGTITLGASAKGTALVDESANAMRGLR